jgi:hypothetical protein
MEMHGMNDGDYARKLDELNRLLNDPDVPMQPGLVWRLIDEVMEHDVTEQDLPDAAKQSPGC